MTVNTFNNDSNRRISRMVRQAERLSTTSIRRFPYSAGRQLIIANAKDSIEAGRFGDVFVAEADGDGDFDRTMQNGRTISGVYNPGQKVWSGSRLLLTHVSKSASHAGYRKSGWHIVHAFSATRIRGTAAADITPDSSGTLNNVVALDGYFNSATATVWNVTTDLTINSGDLVCAVLNWDGGTSKWDAKQCAGAPASPVCHICGNVNEACPNTVAGDWLLLDQSNPDWPNGTIYFSGLQDNDNSDWVKVAIDYASATDNYVIHYRRTGQGTSTISGNRYGQADDFSVDFDINEAGFQWSGNAALCCEFDGTDINVKVFDTKFGGPGFAGSVNFQQTYSVTLGSNNQVGWNTKNVTTSLQYYVFTGTCADCRDILPDTYKTLFNAWPP